MTNPRLSVGIPSYRKLALSGDSIESAVNFCRKNNYQLVVSDNSGEDEKEAKLRGWMQGDNMLYIKSPPCGMMDNWFRAFDATTGDYILMMGDDDKLFSFGSTPAFNALPADIAGIRPNILSFVDPGGIRGANFSAIMGASGPERVMEHTRTSNGANLGIFTFWRRDVFEPVMKLWFNNHPTKSTYCDWAVMNALVSSGRVVLHPSACYFYDISNWAGDNAFIQAQVEKAFVNSGLPASAVHYSALLNAVDTFIFTYRKSSPLGAGERLPTAMFCMDMYLKSYTANLPRASAHENAAKILVLSEKLVGNDHLPAIFGLMLEILAEIQPGLDEKYKSFYETAIGKPWGEF